MPVLKNPRHEKFAQEVAKGSSAAESYRKAYKCQPQTAATEGPRLLRDDPHVVLRVEEIHNLTNQIAAEKLKFTKEDALRFLADAVETPIGEVDHTSRLCQERTHIVGKEEDSVRVKMPGKIDALKLMAQLCGWNAPEKIEVEAGDTLTSFMAQLATGGRKGE